MQAPIPEPGPTDEASHGAARLVVAPHADDEVLGCGGGILAKYAADSAVVVLASPEPQREREFYAAQDILGYTESWFLDLPDGSVGQDMHGLVGMLDTVLDRFRPDELYLPYPSMHQDHVAAYEAGMRSARLSMSQGHWFPPTVMVYDVAAYDVVLYPTDLRWNVFEALSEREVDQKVQAVMAYASQHVEGPHPANGIRQSAAALGAARQVAWAEQFALVRSVRRPERSAEAGRPGRLAGHRVATSGHDPTHGRVGRLAIPRVSAVTSASNGSGPHDEGQHR